MSEMAKVKRCFPRMSKYWVENEQIQLNAYFNVLKYAGSLVDLQLLELTFGGFLPEVKNDVVKEKRVGKEFSLAYSHGLYLETFYHDNSQLFEENVKKNLQMRLAPPIVFLDGSIFGEREKNIPAVCCGYSDNDIEIVNPYTGKEILIKPESCAVINGQRKMIMLNVPGMTKITDVSIRFMVQSSVSYFLKRFDAYRDLAQHIGFVSTKALSETNLVQQREWLAIASKYLELLDSRTREELLQMMDYYGFSALEEVKIA